MTLTNKRAAQMYVTSQMRDVDGGVARSPMHLADDLSQAIRSRAQ